MNRQRVACFVLASTLHGGFAAFAAAGDPEPDAAAIQSYRAQLSEILTFQYNVARVLGHNGMQDSISAGRVRFQALTDDDVARLLRSGADLSRLHQAAQELDRLVREKAPGPESASVPSPSLAGLPDASYSFLCGSIRPDTNLFFGALQALQAAAIAWAQVNRLCEQVLVSGGEGGNNSQVCQSFDMLLEFQRALFADLDFCAHDIESAEINGTYDRVGHLHTDLEALNGNVDASRDAIIANDQANAAAIVGNDNANRAAIVANDNANRAAIVANDNANRDIILAELESCSSDFEPLKKLEIEDNLARGKCPAWMYTPKFLDAAHTVLLGGHLEQVLDVIDDVIDNAAKLRTVGKHDLEEARSALEAARKKAAARPLEAGRLCDRLLEAYEEATASPKGEHHKD